MIFKTHIENIPQIEATLDAFGTCYFHGDGNMYSEKEASDFRKDFSNPKNEECTYRIKFERGQQVPQTVEALNEALLKARNSEVMAGMAQTTNSNQKTITVKKKEGDEGSKLQVKPGNDDAKSYGKMKKDELVALATERNIEIPEGAKVDDIVSLLKAQDEA